MKHIFGTGRSRILDRGRDNTQARGNAAEQLAAHFLTRQGLITLARQVRCRSGEIDLICRDRDTLVFVEVRLRAPSRFGDAAMSITPSKQQRIISAARWWLANAGRTQATRPMRFDVVLMDRLEASAITWIRGAFDTNSS